LVPATLRLRRSGRPRRWRLLAAALLLPFTAIATENGTTAFPNGNEDFLTAAMPPPGWYGLFYANRYHAGLLADDAGQSLFPSFSLSVNAIVPRFDWVKPVSILGADRWGTLLVVPWLDLTLEAQPAPGVMVKGAQRGLGDLTLGNGLHWTFAHFEMVNAIDVGAPTGAYHAADLVNPGLNHWVLRFNHIGTWRPNPAWEFSYRLHTDCNFRNTATDYRSGQTAYLNWALGWRPNPALTLGLAGYFLRQLTDDRQNGAVVGAHGNRVRVDGIGPCLKYFQPNHVMLTAKYFREFDARNHPRGDQFWFYVAVPLGSP
jgi:hypothetical protein